VVPVVRDLVPANAERLLESAGVILDGTDNFETRFLINEVAVKRSIPWIYGAAVSTHGSIMPVLPGQTACLECIFEGAPQSRQPTCDTAGVLNAVTALIGSLQAVEALKVLAGRTEAVDRRLLTVDVWTGERSAVRTETPRPQCATCGLREFSRLASRSTASARICGRDAVQVPARDRPVDLAALAQSLSKLGEVRSSELAVRFSCPPHALTVFPDGRAIVKGTQDLGVARSLYARYIGD
jgi:adenylyltransferase/sulfurtransferase